MSVVFFSCAYKEDPNSAEYFKYLIKNADIVISLDPPKERVKDKPAVNSAKLEKHLRHCDGMIAVLHKTAEGVSPYVLYEIGLAQRSGKPLLVFFEDNLSNDKVPDRILKQRFSRRSIVREVREHQHAIKIFKDYVGRDSPRYQLASKRKTCILVGGSVLPHDQRELLAAEIDNSGYSPIDVSLKFGDRDSESAFQDEGIQDEIETADLAVCIVDDPLRHSQFLMGAIRWAFVPLISLTVNQNYVFDLARSKSLQPRIVDRKSQSVFEDILRHEFNLFEEDFFDIITHEGIREYMERLVRAPQQNGRFEPGTHDMFLDLISGPNIMIHGSQIGAIGYQPSGSVSGQVRTDPTQRDLFESQGSQADHSQQGGVERTNEEDVVIPLPTSRSSHHLEGNVSEKPVTPPQATTSGITVNQSQVGAIGTQATGTVSGTLQIINADAAKEIDAEALKAALRELYAALGQENLPPDEKIAVQTAVGTAINQDIKEGKVEPGGLVSRVEQVAKTLEEANVVVQKGSSLWDSVQKLAPLIGPIVGGTRVVLKLFGIPVP